MPRISFETDEDTRRRLKAFLAERGLTVTQVMLWCIGSILNGYIDLSPLWLEDNLDATLAPFKEETVTE